MKEIVDKRDKKAPMERNKGTERDLTRTKKGRDSAGCPARLSACRHQNPDALPAVFFFSNKYPLRKLNPEGDALSTLTHTLTHMHLGCCQVNSIDRACMICCMGHVIKLPLL